MVGAQLPSAAVITGVSQLPSAAVSTGVSPVARHPRALPRAWETHVDGRCTAPSAAVSTEVSQPPLQL
jgi:hypothetical protein